MKRILFALIATAAAIAVTSPAFADEALAKSKKCMICHSVEKTKVGPSFQAVAKKYAGQKDVQAKLVNAILKGGSGSFGANPMPANVGVSEAEAKTLVAWILSLK